MVTVNFYPDNKSIQVKRGTTILEAARAANVAIESPCNGTGTCGQCKVRINRQSIVLSCCIQVEDDISVELINNQQNRNLKILSYGKSLASALESFIKKEFLEEENKTLIYAGKELLTVEAGNTEQENYGLVVDIGTTTLVASLVDINTGQELATVSALNPQSLHAEDVLSRIKFASDNKGLQLMHCELVKEINRMINEMVNRVQVSKGNIYEVVFSGNTAMLHLATNTNPSSLGKYPYTPQIFGGQHLKLGEHSLDIARLGLIYLPPIISAYVGADIISGILATDISNQKGITLLVDIGTNGEIVLGVDGKLLAASTAAGPAFEGVNITCGMRAGQGAVELFNLAEDGSIEVKTIGESPAIGICGSGLLDIIGELVDHGVINRNGRFVDGGDIPTALQGRLLKQEGKTVFDVAEGVYLSQKDIRQVQLAKGAIRAGIESLLQAKGIQACEVDKVLIAGSFGYHLRAKSLINIGLLPEEFADKIEFIGNTSKSGGQAFLLNKSYRQQMGKIANQVEVLELANYKDFNKVFINCLNF